MLRKKDSVLNALCEIKNIDYVESLISLIPILDHFRIPLGVGRVALRLMPRSALRGLVFSVAQINKRRILGILQDLATRNKIEVKFQNLIILGDDNMLKIGINVDDLDLL